jgi:fructuronate reductase
VAATLGVAAWMRFVSAGRSDTGRPLTVDDPLAGEIAERLHGADDAEAVVTALLGMTQIFDAELASDAHWRALLIDHVTALTRDGAQRTACRIAG